MVDKINVDFWLQAFKIGSYDDLSIRMKNLTRQVCDETGKHDALGSKPVIAFTQQCTNYDPRTVPRNDAELFGLITLVSEM